MTNAHSHPIRFAMEYGLFLGIYFILKYAIAVLTPRFPLLTIPYMILMCGIPFVAFWMIRRYRDHDNEGYLRFSEGWNVGVMLFFFASLPEALAVYGYCQFIDPEYISKTINQTLQTMETINSLSPNPYILKYLEQTKEADIPSSIQMAFQVIFNNIFVGAIFSLIISLIVKRKRQN